MKEKKKMMRTLLGELEEINAGDGVFRIVVQNLEGKFWPEKTGEGQQVFRLELEFRQKVCSILTRSCNCC